MASQEEELINHKLCTSCNLIISLTNFTIRTDTLKYKNQCNFCISNYIKKYRTTEKCKNAVKQYLKKNKDRINDNYKCYYQRNKETIKQRVNQNYHSKKKEFKSIN